MTQDAQKVLLVGSGLTATLASDFDLTSWTVVALHHGWQALPPDRWNVFLHCHDAPDEMFPEKTRPEQLIVNTLQDYIYTEKQYYTRNFRRQSGYCRTLFLTGIWWVIHNMNPGVIGVIGCDMHYPGKGNNTFYGNGETDPLKHDPLDMQRWLGYVSGYCRAKGIGLYNFSPIDSPTVLPFEHKQFQEALCRAS